MDITLLDFILLEITSYLFGIATGLMICCKYNDKIMKSRNLDNIVGDTMNHQNLVYPPQAHVSPIIQASAPPSHNPVKLTIE